MDGPNQQLTRILGQGGCHHGPRALRHDLTDAQWVLIEPIIALAMPGGCPRSVKIHEVINAIFYLLRTSSVWRMLPHDLSPWGPVFGCGDAPASGKRSTPPCPNRCNEQTGRDNMLSAAIRDSQNLKTTDKGGTELGRCR